MEGEVLEAFPNGMFKVQLDNGHEALSYLRRQDAPVPDQDLPGGPSSSS